MNDFVNKWKKKKIEVIERSKIKQIKKWRLL